MGAKDKRSAKEFVFKKKKMEIQKKKREEAGEIPASPSKGGKLEDLLPEVDSLTAAVKSVPLIVADVIEGPPLPPDALESVDALTSDEEWSDDEPIDIDVDIFKNSLVLTKSNHSFSLDDSDDEGWE